MKEKFSVTVKGVSPLLQNKYIPQDNNKSKKKGAQYIPLEDAEAVLYKDGKGKISQPAIHFEAAMIKAAANFKFSGKKTYKEPFKAGVFVTPDLIHHKNDKWEVDLQPAVVNRSRIMRSRPRFDNWELDFDVEIIDERITGDTVKRILEEAGKYNGIGDQRPRYGRFEVKKFKRAD